MGTHRALSSSFLGFPFRILNINHKKTNYFGAYGHFSKLGSLFRVIEAIHKVFQGFSL